MAKRQVVHVPSLPSHMNPIPTCVTLGDLILPSVISGRDPSAPSMAKEPEAQIAQAFVNLKNVVEAAGGSTDTIGKVVVYLKDFKHREIVNREWVKMFADENNRPARHVMKADLQGDTLIQMDVIAAKSG
jgi:enamine deaminase RidA (YjgF/YER057c/UK114 family)